MNNERQLATFCKNVTYLREKKQLTKKQMANIMGVNVNTLNSIENGVVPSKLSSRVLINLYNHFHISLDTFFNKDLENVFEE